MRTIKYVIYIGLLAASLLMGAYQWKILFIAIVSSAAYFPNFPFWPLWLPLGLVVVGYLVFFLLGAALRFSISMKHHVMVIVLFGVVLAARVVDLFSPVAQTGWRDGSDAPPQLMMARAVSRLKSEVDVYAKAADNHTYPVDPEVLREFLRDGKKILPSGFRSHGLRACVNLVVIDEAQGPFLAVKPGDQAGTIYYAVSEDKGRYWMTLVGLADLPAGRPGIMVGADNQPIVFSSQDEVPKED